MLSIGKEIQFRLAAILLAHWSAFVSQHRKWIRPVILETVRKIIGRLIRHIPDKNFKMVRHAGLFATRWKARYMAQARAALAQKTERVAASIAEAKQVSLLPWRERQTAERGNDPLACSVCHVEMQLIEIIFGSHAMIAKYFAMAERSTVALHPTSQAAPG